MTQPAGAGYNALVITAYLYVTAENLCAAGKICGVFYSIFKNAIGVVLDIARDKDKRTAPEDRYKNVTKEVRESVYTGKNFENDKWGDRLTGFLDSPVGRMILVSVIAFPLLNKFGAPLPQQINAGLKYLNVKISVPNWI